MRSNRVRLLNHRIIKDLTDGGFFEQALHAYRCLRLSDVKPDRFTFTYVLKSCVGISAIDEAMSIHSHIFKCGFVCNLLITNSLIEVYSNFGALSSARQLFDDMPQRNLASWNLMISGYGKNGHYKVALEQCSYMKHEGLVLDKVGVKIVLPIIGHVKAFSLGKCIHAHVINTGLSKDTAVVTALLDMYSRCGEFRASSHLFDEISHKDVICWNAMITGYSQLGKPLLVLELFKRMLFEGFGPSIPTIFLLLHACTVLSVIQVGKCMHGYITKLGFSSDVSVSGLLIDMYSKCGELGSASRVFSELSRGNVHSWTSMIHGLGMHGYGRVALMAFFKMVKMGIVPDGICFLVLLASFSHCGMMEEGHKIFYYMVSQYGVQPSMEHYASIVDLFGRAGYINEAVGFLSQMPIEPDSTVMGALLSACRIHDHKETQEVFERFFEPKWSAAGLYKVLLGIHACRGRWDEVIKIRRLMKERGLKGTSGCSLIELNP
ncbi:pentatricopeptide repeat-containing protein At1g08070, chloroplastic-like [Musa acuminata AAA Group]|uniref:pentatricopeptide repeat-containing protein At1g08070, chloroplastic-like n=1 Tax=Musa acuminata AAA Group TaxID=214697 RepID=UPI0031DAC6F9